MRVGVKIKLKVKILTPLLKFDKIMLALNLSKRERGDADE